MLKKVLKGSSAIIVIFGVVSLFLYLLDYADVAREIFITGLLFAIAVPVFAVYENKNWSLLKQSLVQLAILLVGVTPIFFFSGWVEINNAEEYFGIFIIIVSTTLVVWLLNLIIVKFFGKWWWRR